MNLTHLRFLGFQNTPFLWKGNLDGIEQFDIDFRFMSIDKRVDNLPDLQEGTIRLGNYVERFVSYELSQNESVEILKENAQIIADKTTLGEIDCLLLHDNQPVHVEIAYKFYLYDASVGSSFLEHWIGPNRRDSLVLKLRKMQEKQFPLLYSEACESLLSELNINTQDIQQRTYFKAQLFIPYQEQINLEFLNDDCICGFYLRLWELDLFKDCKFYLPKKLDWLIDPHVQVDWMNLENTKKRIKEFHARQSAPLCWVKYPNGNFDKLFVVWF